MNSLLPIFMKIENSKCIVVGGGEIALQKINQLIDSKAKVTVIAPKIIKDIACLPVNLIYREYKSSDIDLSKIIIAATDDNNINRIIFNDANKRGIPVNVVDEPELCSFYMGSVYKDKDLKIAISTNGKCPSLGTYLRDHIKNISKGLWGIALNDLAIKREKIIKTLSNYAEKKDIMSKLVRNTFQSKQSDTSMGKVFLVGAGPGDPELITAKGFKVIQSADLILHDALIHPHLVFEINPLAKKIFVGKRNNKHSVSQDSIHSIMLEEALKGKIVVRLKGGDPFIFGRGGEEVIALVKEGIKFEIIPGVTAGLGAASAFGIPLTHRDDATSTLFITGHQCETAKKQDWKLLARIQSTLVFYMGFRRLKEIVEGLANNGKSKDTPIAIIQNATLDNQKIIISDINNILKEVKKYNSLTPAIIIIGNVVNNYHIIKDYIDTISSNEVFMNRNIDFDIWKNKTIIS